MLRVPKLDDTSYEQLVGRGISQIPMYTDEWTDFNSHDPGVTMLQTFAWLTDTLNYYIDATGEQHRLRYLNLLGIQPVKSPASCNIALGSKRKNICVARGAKLVAGDTVFETQQSYNGNSNQMKSLFCEVQGNMTDLTTFAGVDGEYATIFSHIKGEQSVVYIGFERGLSLQTSFFVDVAEHENRAKFTDSFFLTGIEWEYYDGKRWQPATVEKDDTCGFLRSGFINLSLASKTKLMEDSPVLPKGYYLRAKHVSGQYDALPRIGKLYTSCVTAVQTNTFSRTVEFLYDGQSETIIDCHIAQGDIISILVEQADGYSLWYSGKAEQDSLCDVVESENPCQSAVAFDQNRFGAQPALGQKILAIVTAQEYYESLQLGVTSGFAGEKMQVELENIYQLRLALVQEKDGRPFYTLWDTTDDISGAPCDAQVFEYDRNSGEVVFGDGINGIQPHTGQFVMAVTANTSVLDKGNARAVQINRLIDSVYEDITVYNPKDAADGKRSKNSYELEQEIEEKIYNSSRAVTTQDYISIVKKTGGLIIDRVAVISGANYHASYNKISPPNTVILAVKPYSEKEKHPALSNDYHNRIKENIEKHRLLACNIEVIPARYVRIEIAGRIVLTENTAQNRSIVSDKIEQLIDFSHSEDFGHDIIYGRVFSQLEMLSCVAKISDIAFSCSGEGAHKNLQGDIVLYPGALACVSNINIEFAQRGS